MQCGDILGFVSDQAENHSRKFKWHVVICVSDNIFLFINTSGSRKGVMHITKNDWPDMPKDESFISCTPLQYAPTKYKNAHPKGRLTDTALERLMQHLNESEMLVESEKEVLVNAIYSYLEAKS